MLAAISPVGSSHDCLTLVKQHKQWKPFGFLLSIFGQSFKVQDEATGKGYYVGKKGLVAVLTGRTGESDRVAERVLEVLNPVIGKKIKVSKIGEVRAEIGSIKGEKLIEKLEAIRDRHLPKVALNLEELKRTLKPGDILFHKCHEESSNIICTMQKLFKGIITGKKEREGHKYSHAAMYVGNGEVAEAVGPHGKDPQVRILRLDDPRFALSARNEYRVARTSNEELGAKAAQVFRSFAKPISPSPEGAMSRFKTLKYNFIEAARSLWHPSYFGFFARQRYLKYHADYTDGKTPTQIILPRRLFCSYAVSMAYQIADGLVERKTGPRNLKEIVGEPPTKINNCFLRMVVRAVWARYQAFVHRRAIDAFVQIKYDAVRANPQDMRNFVLRNPKLFKDQMIIENRPG